MGFSVVIPTLRAAGMVRRLAENLLSQSAVPEEILIVDSQSEDGTVQCAKGLPRVRAVTIAREDFDHGGTRDWALRQTTGEFVLFMTQDALPTGSQSVEQLLAPFEDARVAMVGGRQIAWPDARPEEKLVRAYNYPAESRVWDREDAARMGVHAYLISDVFAAYRRDAYLRVGGFDSPIMTNEDMLIAERFLRAGYRLAYSGDAAVYHSHNMTFLQEFRRNYIVGRTLKRYEERFQKTREISEGVKFASAVLLQLAREGHACSCMRFTADCAARLLGNRLGRLAEAREMRAKKGASCETEE